MPSLADGLTQVALFLWRASLSFPFVLRTWRITMISRVFFFTVCCWWWNYFKEWDWANLDCL